MIQFKQGVQTFCGKNKNEPKLPKYLPDAVTLISTKKPPVLPKTDRRWESRQKI